MPKINQEEYEVLKELDDEWKWIARDEDRGLYAFTEKPVRKYGPSPYWDTKTAGPYTALELIDEIHLFRFIQWEDGEPHNIAELIEEYEIEQYIKESVELGEQAMRDHARKQLQDESEETEVKKDLDWVIQEIHTTRKVLADSESSGNETADEFTFNNGKEAGLVDVLKLLDQLDEPEVLTQEWIEDNEYRVIEYPESVVPSKKLQNLLVPKQEEVKRAQIPEWIIEWYQGANNEFSTLEDVFSNLSHDTNYNIMDSDKFRSRIMKYGGFSKMYEALSHIYFGAYEIEEEEQKCVVEFPNITGSDERYLVQGDDGDLWVDGDLDYLQRFDIPKHIFTEEEIKSFDKDYWAFAVKVEELEE